MRIVTIRTQRDVEGALGRLIPAEAEPEARHRAETLLRAANPHLDLDNLRPGVVLIVPEAPELNREHTEEVRGVALTATLDVLKDRMRAAQEQYEANADLTAATRDAALKDLRSRSVKAIEDREPDLKQELEHVRRVLAAEAKEDKAQRAEFARLLKQAADDFEALRARFG